MGTRSSISSSNSFREGSSARCRRADTIYAKLIKRSFGIPPSIRSVRIRSNSSSVSTPHCRARAFAPPDVASPTVRIASTASTVCVGAADVTGDADSADASRWLAKPPPPSILTSSHNFAATDAFAGTGTARVAVLNQATGAVVEFVDVNLAGLGATATVNDVINAINAGLTGTPAALNANGQLVLTAQSTGQGFAINENTSAVTVVGAEIRSRLRPSSVAI